MSIKLKQPIFDQSTYLGYNIGIRPARHGGPRLEKEKIKDKIIYHNYGHAGYGVAMSWGACKIMTTMFANEFGSKHKQIAIVGAGYMGLHSALQLTDLGYDVTIYAKTLPSEWGLFGASDKKLTSQIAAGKIELGYADMFVNKQQTRLIYDESIRYIKNCHERKMPGFARRDIYFVEHEDPTSHFHPESITKPEHCKVTFGNGREFDAVKTTFYSIDGDVYLNYLVKEVQRRGVRILTKEFKDLNEILRLDETIIFNCTGYQSKYLFNDDKLYAKKGVMLSFANPNNVDFYFDTNFTKKIKSLNIYPMNNRLSVGLTWIYEEAISEDQDKHHRDVMMSVVEDFKKRYLLPAPKL